MGSLAASDSELCSGTSICTGCVSRWGHGHVTHACVSHMQLSKTSWLAIGQRSKVCCAVCSNATAPHRKARQRSCVAEACVALGGWDGVQQAAAAGRGGRHAEAGAVQHATGGLERYGPGGGAKRCNVLAGACDLINHMVSLSASRRMVGVLMVAGSVGWARCGT